MPLSEDQEPPSEPSTVAPERPRLPKLPESEASIVDGVEHPLDPASVTAGRIAGGIFSMILSFMRHGPKP